jgi:uracil-DNA glycosylase
MTRTGWDPLRGTDWDRLLRSQLTEQYWDELETFIKGEYSRPGVYPPADDIFAALHLTHCAQTKVVIVGQDPYPAAGRANGMAFAVAPDSRPLPGSLANIHQELHADVCVPIPEHGSLESWGREGVLLLNSTLTFRAGAAALHQRMWKTFTDAVIRVAERKMNPVFILWGKVAQNKALKIIDVSERVIMSPHPARRSASKGFFESKPFSRCNCQLSSRGQAGIDWRLTK